MSEQNLTPAHTSVAHGAEPSGPDADAAGAPAQTAPESAPAAAAGVPGTGSATGAPAPGGAETVDSPVPEGKTSTGARSARASRARTPRARAPKQDTVLTEAVALAREAVVLGGADASGVGEHVGVRVHEDRLLTHLFDCELPGYPGWTWYATVARAPRSKHVTVCESGLLAGPRSLLAPEWVPWEERMQSVQDQDQDQEAGRQGGPEGTDPSTPPSDAEHTSDAPVGQDAEKGASEDPVEDASGDAGGAAARAVVVPPSDPFDAGAQLPDSPHLEDGASS